MSDKKNKIIKSAGFDNQTEIGVMSSGMIKDIAKIEDVGTAAQRATYEAMIVIDSILENDFNFSKEDFEHFHEKFKRMLSTIEGLSVDYSYKILNFEDMAVVGRAAERWLQEQKKQRHEEHLLNSVNEVKKELEKGK